MRNMENSLIFIECHSILRLWGLFCCIWEALGTLGAIQSTSRVSLEGSWAALGAPRASPGVLGRVPDGPWVLSGRALGPPCGSLGVIFGVHELD